MSDPNEQSNAPFKFTFKDMALLVVVISACCAIIPGVPLVLVGATPVAAGFIVLVIGDQRGNGWITLLGAILMAGGLIMGGLLMAIVQGLRQ